MNAGFSSFHLSRKPFIFGYVDFVVDEHPTIDVFIVFMVFTVRKASFLTSRWQHIVKWVNRHLERDHVLKSVEEHHRLLFRWSFFGRSNG